MNKKIFLAFVGINLVIAPLVSLATTGVEGSGTTSTTATTTPSVNQGANESNSGNSFAQALNTIVGGGEVALGGNMIKTGQPRCSEGDCTQVLMGIMTVGMGVQNLMQAQEHGSAASSAGLTGFQSNGLGGTTTATDPTNPYSAITNSDPNVKAVASTLKQLAASGVYNPKTGTYTVGDKTYKQSDFSSAGSMASAGFSKGMIDGALAMNADAEKKAIAKLDKLKSSENGFVEGGGGGGAGPVTSTDEVGAHQSIGKTKKNFDREPTNLAGMSKNYNGEPIGVAADSIFLMMSRRYQVKDSQESFFTPSETAAKK